MILILWQNLIFFFFCKNFFLFGLIELGRWRIETIDRNQTNNPFKILNNSFFPLIKILKI